MSAGVLDAMVRAVAWTAGVVDGLLMAVKQRRDRRLPVRRVADPYQDLRRAILGRTRSQIAQAMGTPTTASLGFGVQTPGQNAATYWDATTWYYPFDPDERKAIAIRFVGTRAREVELIGVPE